MFASTASLHRHSKRDLLSRTSDWGVSVSEAQGRRSPGRRALAAAGYAALAAASFLVLPPLVGLMLFSASVEVIFDLGIVAAIVIAAMGINALSRRGPRNALQIDHDAGEVRLGSLNPAGAFVRHRVCPFRQIDDVSVDLAAPALRLTISGEVATIRFQGCDGAELTGLAATISDAVAEAKAAPIRSRIQSSMHGFEAGMREVGNRVRSRVQSRFA